MVLMRKAENQGKEHLERLWKGLILQIIKLLQKKNSKKKKSMRKRKNLIVNFNKTFQILIIKQFFSKDLVISTKNLYSKMVYVTFINIWKKARFQKKIYQKFSIF